MFTEQCPGSIFLLRQVGGRLVAIEASHGSREVLNQDSVFLTLCLHACMPLLAVLPVLTQTAVPTYDFTQEERKQFAGICVLSILLLLGFLVVADRVLMALTGFAGVLVQKVWGGVLDCAACTVLLGENRRWLLDCANVTLQTQTGWLSVVE